MGNVVAICLDNRNYRKNLIFDKEFCVKNYPWLEWTIEFKRLAEEAGHVVKTGDLVMQDLKNGKYDPKEVLVYSEGYTDPTEELIERGAVPYFIYYLEAPIVNPKFYDAISKYCGMFTNQMFFGVAFKWQNSRIDLSRRFPGVFPRFHNGDVRSEVNWDERKFLVMVAANKYYKFPIWCKNPLRTMYRIQKKITILNSKTYKKVYKTQLHDKRIEAISYFGRKKRLDLFGHGWHNRRVLPNKLEKLIRPVLIQMNPEPCDDKIEVIRNYKFALCFENQTVNGYITEKIIDCFVAGTIPIYYGAPDISQYIPDDCFINGFQFKTFEDLEKYLDNMSEEEASKMIESGWNYITTYSINNNVVYSHEGYAKFLAGLLE